MLENRVAQVVIVGGGFAGLNAVKSLRKAPVQITLIDRRNFHLFQPLLYQVATGGLSPADISSPLRAILKRQRNVRVLQTDVTGFNIPNRQVLTRDGSIPYDYLAVATGSKHHYFGHDEWAASAPGLKTIEDALDIRKRVLESFEHAELEQDENRRDAWLTFVVVGGGPTGVELAGTLGELAHHTLRGDFRRIDPGSARILVVEAGPRLLANYPDTLSRAAERSLGRLGVAVVKNAVVESVSAESVLLRCGGETRTVGARTVLWAAGVKGSPLGALIAEATGARLDRQGRIEVESDLSIDGHPELFVLGDLACLYDRPGNPLPAVAPVAIQQGRYFGRVIRDRLRRKPSPSFRYKDLGNMAVIGRSAAVVDLGRFRFSGLVAWLLWLFVHLINLVGHQNRLLVLVQWAWNYFTRNRSARLITHVVSPEFDQDAEERAVAANSAKPPGCLPQAREANRQVIAKM